MAETTAEIDAINHLLEVEKNASTLINDAAQEADRRLSAARAKYSSEYKERYEKAAGELETKYLENQKSIEKKYNDELEAYKQSLASKSQNFEAFSKLLDTLVAQ